MIGLTIGAPGLEPLAHLHERGVVGGGSSWSSTCGRMATGSSRRPSATSQRREWTDSNTGLALFVVGGDALGHLRLEDLVDGVAHRGAVAAASEPLGEQDLLDGSAEYGAKGARQLSLAGRNGILAA